MMAILNDVILNIFIAATIMETANRSLTSQFLSEKYQPKVLPIPSIKLMISITLISIFLILNPFFRKFSLIRNSN